VGLSRGTDQHYRKAIEHARATRSAFDWRPESALVLGTGSLGLLTVAMFAETLDYERVYCLGRKDRPHPTIDIAERLGATYIDSRETPVSAIAGAYEPMDVVYEATGHAKHAFESIDALAPNGVAALLGVPADWSFEVDGGRLHRDLVLHNKALVGSVNSNRRHFERAIETLSSLPDWVLESIVTGVYGLEAVDQAFPKATARVLTTGRASTTGADDDTTIKRRSNSHPYENVDDLIESAAELAARGLSKGEIADELNVSRGDRKLARRAQRNDPTGDRSTTQANR